MASDQDQRAAIFKRCDEKGEAAVRAEVDRGGNVFQEAELSILQEWLYAKDLKRNERMNRLATVSAISAGVAAVAALVTAIITSCHSAHP